MKQISSILWILLASGYLVSPAYGSAGAEELPAKSKASLSSPVVGKSTVSTTTKQVVPAPVKPSAGKGSPASSDKKVGVEQGTNSNVGKGVSQTKESAKENANAAGVKKDTPEKARVPEKSKDTAVKSIDPTVKSKDSTVKTKDSSDSKGTAQDHSVNHKKPSSGGGQSRFVPPPPPSVPTMTEMGMPGMGSTMIFVGENIDYMPAADLRDLKEKTDKEIERFRRDVDEMASALAEKKQKSDNFDQLFAEGVISRRELETSKKESEKATEELGDAKRSLTMLEQKHIKIEQRLAFLNKPKKSTNSHESKKQHHR